MSTISSDMLLHPELLSTDILRQAIKERHLKVDGLESMSRESILVLIHQYCVPHAQRKYRDSGRGKLLNKNRTETNDSLTQKSKTNTLNWHHKAAKRDQPDLSGQVKRIKLNHNSEQRSVKFNSQNNAESKRKIDSDIEMTDAVPGKKVRAKITWP